MRKGDRSDTSTHSFGNSSSVLPNHNNEPPELTHTLAELHFADTCLKSSWPILSFDSTFNKQPYLQLVNELLSHVFGVSQNARKANPFVIGEMSSWGPQVRDSKGSIGQPLRRGPT